MPYRTLSSHSLEAEVFEDIVKVPHEQRDIGADICRHLLGLLQAPRMSALVMFIDNEGKLQEQGLQTCDTKKGPRGATDSINMGVFIVMTP